MNWSLQVIRRRVALALIGPEGLAALAARRAEFAGLAPKPGPMLGSSPATATKTPAHAVRRWRFSPTVWLCVGIVLAALSFDRIAAMTLPPASSGPLSRNASDWPRCLRLDAHTDGCVYRTSGNRLSLSRAAALLRIDAGDLAGDAPDFHRLAGFHGSGVDHSQRVIAGQGCEHGSLRGKPAAEKRGNDEGETDRLGHLVLRFCHAPRPGCLLAALVPDSVETRHWMHSKK